MQCLLKGTPVSEIAKKLEENGFVPDVIKHMLASNLPDTYSFSTSSAFYSQLAQSAITQNANAQQLANSDDIQLYRIDNFLSEHECHAIIELTMHRLKPSQLAGAKSADNIRTSSTCELAFLDNELVMEIDKRIVSALALGAGENEVIQAQHYNVGEYYKPHYDFFPPGSPQYKAHCSVRGQRTWTCMIYLNDHCEGGQTRFTKLDVAVTPKTGTALFWNNLLPSGEPNAKSIHFAEPVIHGNKTVITKWFRTVN